MRLRVCAGWSEPLLVAHTTVLEISSRSPYSVGRCVIPWEFLGKSVKHILSFREMYSV